MLLRCMLVALGLLLGIGFAWAQKPPVAKKHQALYNQLESELAQFATQVSGTPTQQTVVRGAAADIHTGPAAVMSTSSSMRTPSASDGR